SLRSSCSCFAIFFSPDTVPTAFYTLSLHDALPIYRRHFRPVPHASRVLLGRPIPFCLLRFHHEPRAVTKQPGKCGNPAKRRVRVDRKSTRLNSSHLGISYAVFCLKKKKHRPNIRNV